MKKCIEEYNEKMKVINDRFQEILPIVKELEAMDLNIPEGRLNGFSFMYHWGEMPLVLSLWECSLEDIHDSILKPIHKKFKCFFPEMEVQGSIKKIFWKTEIRGIPFQIQLIEAVNCEWKQRDIVQLDKYDIGYELVCSGEEVEGGIDGD